MYLEILFLLFFGLGYVLLRLDKFPRRKTPVSYLKAIRGDATGGHPSAVLARWHQIAATKAPCQLEVLKLVVQAALQEGSLKTIKEVVQCVVANGPDCYLQEDKHKGVGKAAACTYIMNTLLQTLSTRRGPLSVHDVYGALSGLAAADEETHEHLVAAHVHVGDVDLARETLEGMRKQFGAIPAKAYQAIVIGLARARCMDEALGFVKEMGTADHTVPAYVTTEIFRAARERAELLKTLSQLAHVRLSAEAIALTLEEAGREQSVAKAEIAVTIAEERGVALLYTAFEALVKVYISVASVKAIEYFDRMVEAGFQMNEGTTVGFIAACAPVKFMKLAEHVVRHRRTAGGMSLPIYSSLMKVYAYSKLYDQCCDLYQEVLKDGIQPDDVMRGCVLNFAARAGNTELADELFRTQRPTGPVEVQNYMSQIRSCRQKKDVNRAISLYKELLRRDVVDKAAFNSVLDVCVVSGEIERAETLFRDASPVGLDIVAYNTLVKGYCGVAREDKVYEVFDLMRSRGLAPNDVSYNCLLNVFVRRQQYDKAWQVVGQMRDEGISEDGYTISTLMKALKTCDNRAFTQNVLSLIDTTEVDILNDEVTLNVVLDAFVRCRDMARLTHMCERVKDAKIIPSVAMISTLMKAFSSLRRIDEVVALWTEMTEVREMQPNEISLGCITDALVSHSRVDEAAALVNAWKGRVKVNCVIYSTLMKGFTIIRQPLRALEVFEQMQAEGVPPNLVTFNTLLDAFGRIGDMAKANELLDSIGKYGLKADRISYATLIKGYCMKGEVRTALEMMRSMKQKAVPVDVIIYNTLLDGCVRADMYAQCDELLAEMPTVGMRPSTFTVTVMIKRYGKEGKVQKAFDVAYSMPKQYDFALTTQVLTCLISACLSNKQYRKAFEVYEDMRRSGPAPDALTYEKLTMACQRTGDSTKLVDLVQEMYGLGGGGNAEGDKRGGGKRERETGDYRTTRERGGGAQSLAPLRGGAQSDPQVLKRAIEYLVAKGQSDSHAVPLVQRLRHSGVSIPQHVVAMTLRGAVQSAQVRRR